MSEKNQKISSHTKRQGSSKQKKEEMIHTCASIWKYISDNEKIWIQKIWTALLKQAKILKWESTGKHNEYQLELENEVLGQHPDVPIGQLILKQKMKIAFSEKKVRGTETYQHIITFPDQGVYHHMGIGWLSKKTPLESLITEEDQNQEVWCTAEGFGQSVSKPADITLKFWNKAKWN